MEPDFWHKRWRDNNIGFHQAEINEHLREFWDRLQLQPGARVFVPLCGKSLDMRWLRDNFFEVIGVEISPLAVAAFFEESGPAPEIVEQEDFEVYQAPGIRIYCGDFFDLKPAHLEGVQCVFDRAALIALPPEVRKRYVERLLDLLNPQAPLLLITFEYPQDQKDGPPFSVEEDEVRGLFGNRRNVECLLDLDRLSAEPRFAEQGITSLHEKVYLLS